ncbi:MAG: HAD family hydrolase [Erysipelotrichales bacterium]|nr:HAD family hydrolase [Erysipelotrichales bacterium]
MRAPKVVVCDMDSTLVIKHQELTERAKKAIHILREHGVYFGVASGRPIFQLRHTTDRWDIDQDLMIAMNGCELYDVLDDKHYNYFMMEPEWIKETIELMSPFDCNPMVALNGEQYVGHTDELVEMSEKFMGKKMIVVDDISELYKEANAKIMFRVNAEDMPKIEAHIAAHPSPNYKGFKTQPTMMEFANINASKGYALVEFCKLHNIDMQDVYAFGDTTNDNEMLEVAGVGVCMANGSDDTKAVADVITELGCDDDGWADFVENHILKPLGWM